MTADDAREHAAVWTAAADKLDRDRIDTDQASAAHAVAALARAVANAYAILSGKASRPTGYPND